MPFVPHTEEDIRTMLAAVGVKNTEALFDEIPSELRIKGLSNIPPALSELGISQLMQQRAAQDGKPICFIGAGAYEHHIPAAVWEIATRGEFYSAYTPYQAEASQGTLQLLYEYQTMMVGLTGMDVSNASLYDGASSLAEAVLMSVRANRKSKGKKILMPRTVHPSYRKTTQTIVRNQRIQLEELDYDRSGGFIDPDSLPKDPGDVAALIIPQPNFFGVLEEVDTLTDWAHAHNMLVIAVVNPLSLSVLNAPGNWGKAGADIVCGDGQPMGIPLSSGGSYFGFMACKQQHVRQMPGRIIGRTTDLEGKTGFSLTLQAREQHIRRSKATSNICTNQGLMVTAATIHMALMGAEGLAETAKASHNNTRMLVDQLTGIDGVSTVFNRPVFHETVLQFDVPVDDVIRTLAAHNVLGGYALADDYPELENSILVCATETRTQADMDFYYEKLNRIFSMQRKARVQ